MAHQAETQADILVAQDKVVERTSKSFVDGVCSGYLTYYHEYRDKRLTDVNVYSFIIQNITDVQGTDTFNTGYCTGWIEALLEDTERCCANMTIQVRSLVQITDRDFQAGFEEAQDTYYADCSIRTDMGRVEVVRAMLTEYAVEMGLSEQQLRRSTGFIIGILSRG